MLILPLRMLGGSARIFVVHAGSQNRTIPVRPAWLTVMAGEIVPRKRELRTGLLFGGNMRIRSSTPGRYMGDRGTVSGVEHTVTLSAHVAYARAQISFDSS